VVKIRGKCGNALICTSNKNTAVAITLADCFTDTIDYQTIHITLVHTP